MCIHDLMEVVSRAQNERRELVRRTEAAPMRARDKADAQARQGKRKRRF